MQRFFGSQEEIPDWTYKDEIAKVKRTKGLKKLGDRFDPADDKYAIPADVNAAYFPKMVVGNTIDNMNEANKLLHLLNEMPMLTAPLLTPHAKKVVHFAKLSKCNVTKRIHILASGIKRRSDT